MPSDDRRGADDRLPPPASSGPAGASTRAATAQLLLHTADTAMYAAENTGKGRAVLAEAVTDVPRCSPR